MQLEIERYETTAGVGELGLERKEARPLEGEGRFLCQRCRNAVVTLREPRRREQNVERAEPSGRSAETGCMFANNRRKANPHALFRIGGGGCGGVAAFERGKRRVAIFERAQQIHGCLSQHAHAAWQTAVQLGAHDDKFVARDLVTSQVARGARALAPPRSVELGLLPGEPLACALQIRLEGIGEVEPRFVRVARRERGVNGAHRFISDRRTGSAIGEQFIDAPDRRAKTAELEKVRIVENVAHRCARNRSRCIGQIVEHGAHELELLRGETGGDRRNRFCACFG